MDNNITLRDFFAGLALAGVAAGNIKTFGKPSKTVEEAATTAFLLADAMLAQRDRQTADQ